MRNIEIQAVNLARLKAKNIRLAILREDKIHPFISGNKYRKLKYNVAYAKEWGYDTLLTFGGAHSNHIAATASAGKKYNLKTIGVIRGEELATQENLSSTLNFALTQGMELFYVSRETYRNKNSASFVEFLKKKFGKFYLLPEGGTNDLAVKGCEEILDARCVTYDYICTPVGTGGTISGLINASEPHQTIIGFSALKGCFQTSEIEKHTSKQNYFLLDTYCFNGYAKIDIELIRFINKFKEETSIVLDPVYTGKMLFGIFDLIENNFFKPNTNILAVHTGGLQGIEGMNQKLLKKGLPQINTDAT